MKYSKFILTGLFSVILLGGCNHQNKKFTTTLINPEIIGRWSDSMGCNLELANQDNHLLLISFKSVLQSYTNVPLSVKKDGVLTRFKAERAGIDFAGAFADGFIMIDHKLCHQALHKDANK